MRTKLTKFKIKAIIAEEIRKNDRVSPVLNEGIMDFLSGIWDLAGEMFGGAISNAFEKSFDAITDIANENIADEFKSGDDAIESLSDLDPEKNEKDRPAYLEALSPAFMKAFGEIVKNLESTKSVKNWTPKSESKEDVAAWKEENGEASSGLSKATGVVKSLSKYLENSGIDFDNAEIETDKANPGEQIKFILQSCKAMREFWNSIDYEEVKDDAGKIVSELGSVESAANEVGKAIADSAKTQQKEWTNLKRTINSIIIQERILQGEKMRITESQLRKTIRKVIKEFSAYQPLYGTEEEIPEEPEQRIHAADTEIESGICPACHGKGIIMGRDCRMCDGTGEFEE